MALRLTRTQPEYPSPWPRGLVFESVYPVQVTTLCVKPPLFIRAPDCVNGTRKVYAMDVYITSFPKSGRTWLRLLMAKAISLGSCTPLSEIKDLKLTDFCGKIAGLSPIQFIHDGSPGWVTPEELTEDKERFRNSRIVLMHRDIRDIAVSYYFQRTLRRDCPFDGSLSDFLRERRGSVASCIRFWNIWHRVSEIPHAFTSLSYEGLAAQTASELARVLRFCDVPSKCVESTILKHAVQFCSFRNMRILEVTDALNTDKLRVGDIKNPESYKTRRGIIGGFRDYLSPEDISFVNHMVSRDLTPELHAVALAADAVAAE